MAAIGVAGCPEPPKPPPVVAVDAGTATSTAATVSIEAAFTLPAHAPQIVARVGSVEISKATLERQLRLMKLQLEVVGIPQALTREVALDSAIEQVIKRELIAALAEELAVSADPKWVAAWTDKLETRLGSDKEFQAMILAAGLTPEQRRVDAEHLALDSAIREKISARLEAKSRTEMRAYYEANKSSFVVRGGREMWRIRVKSGPDQLDADRVAARAKADRIFASLKANPAGFEELAKAESEGGRASEGGYLGFVEKGVLPEAVENQAARLAPGSILPLMNDADGIYIYKVGRQNKERTKTFDEVKDHIADTVMKPLVHKELQAELDRVRRAKGVHIFLTP